MIEVSHGVADPGRDGSGSKEKPDTDPDHTFEEKKPDLSPIVNEI